tara:strand:+ start:320 stop:607 length:288 start_codon:yes stop_codon:yes gene_type:complete
MGIDDKAINEYLHTGVRPIKDGTDKDGQTFVRRTSTGAIILASKPHTRMRLRSHVLCLWGTEYVIWTMRRSDKTCENGHYFMGDFDAAAKAFARM